MIENEKQLQNTLRELAHAPTLGRVCWKLQDTFITGVPDQLYCIKGIVTWLELKHVYPHNMDRFGYFLTGLRPTQYTRLREWADAGGRAYLCISVEDSVYVVPAHSVPKPSEKVSVSRLAMTSTHWVDANRAGLGSLIVQFLGRP